MNEKKQSTLYRTSLRERILDVAMQAFARQGIRAVRMNDIVQALGISKRTLYEIYENKELLLLEGVKKYHARKEEENEQMAKECTNVMDMMLRVYREKINEFNTTCPQFYADISKYPAVLDYLHLHHASAHARFISFLQRGVSEGYFRSDVEVELVAMMFNAITEYIMKNELYNTYSIEQIFHDLVFVSLRGYCTKQGVEAFDHYFK